LCTKNGILVSNHNITQIFLIAVKAVIIARIAYLPSIQLKTDLEDNFVPVCLNGMIFVKSHFSGIGYLFTQVVQIAAEKVMPHEKYPGFSGCW